MSELKCTKKLLCLLLAGVLSIVLFAGCESEAEKMEKLEGPWRITLANSPDNTEALLKGLYFYDEEIALIDLSSLKYDQIIEFKADKTYSFFGDPQSTWAYMREFLAQAFTDMYAGRASIESCYNVNFSDMSMEEFFQFYAELYVLSDFDALLDEFTDSVYDYAALAKPWETGTYHIKGNKILFKITGSSEEEYITYQITAQNTLELIFDDGTLVYQRAN